MEVGVDNQVIVLIAQGDARRPGLEHANVLFVRAHNPFGGARGAGGVEHVRETISRDRRHALFESPVAVCAALPVLETINIYALLEPWSLESFNHASVVGTEKRAAEEEAACA